MIRQLLIGMLALGVLAALHADVVVAQEPGAAPATTVDAGPAAPTRGLDAFPNLPSPFFRGNGAELTNQGMYLSLVKLLFIFVMFAIWAWSGRWVDEDSRGLKVRPEFWNGIVLLAGFAGFLLVLTMPMFAVGFVALAAGCLVPVGIYCNERNQRVPDSAKVLTPNHLKKVGTRLLARVGIHLGTREVLDSAGGPPIRFIGKSPGDKGASDRSRQVEKSKGYMAAKELVYDGIMRRATDVHLEPKEDELSVRCRIDGVMFPAEPFDRGTGDAILNIFKVLSAMDITERRKPQDGSFQAEMENRIIDFRVATQGTRQGEKMSLRILDQGNSVSSLAQLGLRKPLYESLKDVVRQPHGLFLSCGPTGAGKSTTLYAALHEIDRYESNIITIEDPVEYRMENVTQIEINTKAGQTFAGSLRSILRQDPDVVMVGEIRDAETAKIACQASTTGHMVFSTIHANDTFTALFRLIDLGVEPFLLSSSVSAILGQRLVRRLCTECREAYHPDEDTIKKLGLPPAKVEKFYRPPKKADASCPKCMGTGYFGRIGVFELLIVNERLRDMVRDNPSMSAIKAEARKQGMLYMKEEGLRLVLRGVTSLEELLRVVK